MIMPSARHPRRVAHAPIGPFVTPYVRPSPACPEALQLGGGHRGFVSVACSLSERDHVPVLGGHVEADAVPGPAVVPALVARCDGFRVGFLEHAELHVRGRPPARPLPRLSSASR